MPEGKAKPAENKAKPSENKAKPSENKPIPVEESSRILSRELVDSAEISPEAITAGGFVVGVKYTVNSGDTLWDLAGKYYKNPYLWGKIYNANIMTVANPDRIYPQDELIIPDLNEVVMPYRRAEVRESGAAGEAAAAERPSAVPAVVSGKKAIIKAAEPKPGELLRDFDRDFMSGEMPEHQREWSEGLKIVPDNWSDDGEITAKLSDDQDTMEDSFSLVGETVQISMRGHDMVAPGDYLAIYLKGAEAYDKYGNRLGRELQPAGLAEVVTVYGSTVKAVVIDATTAIEKGYVVKKK